MSTRTRVSAKALIVHEGKILVVKERVERKGKEVIIHDFPGGGMEDNESLHETLHREVWEEVGLKVQIERPVGAWDFVLQWDEDLVHSVCVGYQCSVVGSVEIDTSKNPAEEDIFDVVWLTKEEILADSTLFDVEDIGKTVRNVQ